VAFLRGQGIAGVGQSSWGPAVFAVSDQEDHLSSLGKLICGRFSLPAESIMVTRACNRGATVCTVA
jgi:predicted sugar kinase